MLKAFCGRHGVSSTSLCAWRRALAACGESGLVNRATRTRAARERDGERHLGRLRALARP